MWNGFWDQIMVKFKTIKELVNNIVHLGENPKLFACCLAVTPKTYTIHYLLHITIWFLFHFSLLSIKMSQ